MAQKKRPAIEFNLTPTGPIAGGRGRNEITCRVGEGTFGQQLRVAGHADADTGGQASVFTASFAVWPV